jgi:hypothetical protein
VLARTPTRNEVTSSIRRADADLVAAGELDGRNAPFVDEGAVGRLQVRDDAGVFTCRDGAVPPRRRFVVDDDVAALERPSVRVCPE